MFSIHVRFIGNAKSTQYSIWAIIKYSYSFICCSWWIENELNIQSSLCHWIVYIVCKSSYMIYVMEYNSCAYRVLYIIQCYGFDIFLPQNIQQTIISFRVKDRRRADMCLHLMGSNFLARSLSLHVFIVSYSVYPNFAHIFNSNSADALSALSCLLHHSDYFSLFHTATFDVNKIESK